MISVLDKYLSGTDFFISPWEGAAYEYDKAMALK